MKHARDCYSLVSIITMEFTPLFHRVIEWRGSTKTLILFCQLDKRHNALDRHLQIFLSWSDHEIAASTCYAKYSQIENVDVIQAQPNVFSLSAFNELCRDSIFLLFASSARCEVLIFITKRCSHWEPFIMLIEMLHQHSWMLDGRWRVKRTRENHGWWRLEAAFKKLLDYKVIALKLI